nr:hypothetical protein [Bacteroidota bacterium]
MTVSKSISIFTFLFLGFTAFCQIGISTANPEISAELDVVSTSKGVLVPRVVLTVSLENPGPVTNPAVGLLVFNTGPNQEQGFYYWSGTGWTLINSPSADDVSGPVSSTDNAMVRFDGNTGKVIQNSQVYLNDAGDITNVNNLTVDGFRMTAAPSPGYILVSDASGNATWQSAPPIDIEENNILISANVNSLNFSEGIQVQDVGNEKATVTFYANNVSRSLIQLSSSDSLDLNDLFASVAIPWDIVQQRDYGYFVHSTSNNPSRVQVLTHGIYEFNYMFNTISKTVMRKTLRARLRKNGSIYIPNVTCYSFSYNMADQESSHVSSSFLVELNANDYIELVTNGQTNPGPLNLVPYENVFFVRLMREIE